MWLMALIASLGISGCSQHVATCWTQGDGSSVHAAFGYFYDSAEVTVAGPSTFKRIPEGFQGDPCGWVSPAVKGLP